MPQAQLPNIRKTDIIETDGKPKKFETAAGKKPSADSGSSLENEGKRLWPHLAVEATEGDRPFRDVSELPPSGDPRRIFRPAIIIFERVKQIH